MIDTIRFREPRLLLKTVTFGTRFPTGIPHGWCAHLKGPKVCVFTHKTGITATVAERQLVIVQASLARVLFGKNSVVLESDKQIAAAFEKLEKLLSELFLPAIGERIYTRIDLAWQIEGAPRAFIGAYRFCRHPEIRLGTVTYEGSGVSFPGTKMLIRIYDKGLEENRKPSKVVRVEAQLKGKKLEKYLGTSFKRLSFDQAYQAYRAILVQLVPKHARHVNTIARLLATSPRLFDLWAAEVSPRRVKDVQKQIAKIRVKRFRVNFKRLLPHKGPPPVVNC